MNVRECRTLGMVVSDAELVHTKLGPFQRQQGRPKAGCQL